MSCGSPSIMGLGGGLTFLCSPIFKPLASSSLRDLTRKTPCLVALAMAKRVGEIQALSRVVSFSSLSAGLSFSGISSEDRDCRASPSTLLFHSVSSRF